jgi:copper resistance protein B
MIRLALLASAAVLAAGPALAQQMDHAHMPGMQMPAKPASPAPAQSATAAAPAAPAAPPWSGDYAADGYYDPQAMAHARMMAREEMGGMRFSKVMLNLAEYQAGSKGDGYRWDGAAWFGGDINRWVLRSEGEGSVKDGLETGEAQALYSRAVGRYTDLQAGIRQDFSPHARTYAAVGAQSLLPYWFDVEGALFLSTKGELLARVEGSYDLRLFQRVVLQPRAELNFAAQDTKETRTGSGLSNAELGLRLRYEFRREFAPYIGVSWDKRFGKTADYWRAAGDSPESTTFVVGLRTWF